MFGHGSTSPQLLPSSGVDISEAPGYHLLRQVSSQWRPQKLLQGLVSHKLTAFLKSNSPNILALCETNLDDSIDFGNFSVRGYLPSIRKNSTTHMHGLTVYVKEELLFPQDLSLENSADSYLCFRLALLRFTFPSIDHLLHLYARFFILFHLTLMSFSRSTHLLMYLSLETLTSIIRTG